MSAAKYCLLFLILFSSGCKKEKAGGKDFTTRLDDRILVLNEGNFMWNNASFDLLDRDNWQMEHDIFRTANNKSLGDVLQSGVISGGTLWLVLNNSGIIRGVDTGNYKEKWSISTGGSPRYIAFSGNHCWVTDIYSGYINVYDSESRKLQTRIKTGVWCEQLIHDGEYMSVACTDGWLRRYDTVSFRTADSFFVGKNLQKLGMDKNQNIWALASDSGRSKLGIYHPGTRKGKVITAEQSFSAMAMSKNRDSVFLLGNGVFAMPVTDIALPDMPVFRQSGANYYGMGCDPVSGLIFVSDAKDYVSKGQISILDSRGNLYKSLQAGIIPASFVFY